MPSFTATTIAATAFASLALAAPAPAVRDATSAQFYLNVTSANHAGGKFQQERLSTCHTGAGQEALCVGNSGVPFTFAGPSDAFYGPATLHYNLPVTGGSYDAQQFQWIYNTTYPSLGYGFLEDYADSGDEFVVREDGLVGIYLGEGKNQTVFQICPEYADNNKNGFPTLSYVKDNAAAPAGSGCEEVFLYRQFVSI